MGTSGWQLHSLALLSFCCVACRTPEVPPKSQRHVLCNQEDIVQSLEFNPTFHSQPCSTPSREEEPIWRPLRGPTAAERVLGRGWFPEGWSEVQVPTVATQTSLQSEADTDPSSDIFETQLVAERLPQMYSETIVSQRNAALLPWAWRSMCVRMPREE